MLECLRIDGFLFAFNRSFVREGTTLEPDLTIRSLTKLREGLRRYPKGKLAIFGHADYVGNVPYNKKLSERRAEAVYALLTINAGIWQRLYSDPDENWAMDASISKLLKNDKSDIEAYMKKLLKPAGLARGVPTDKFCSIWPKSSPDSPFMGCSEYNPVVVFSPSELKAHRKDHTKRDEENEPNRRVVIFIFDEYYLPLFPCMHSSESSPEDAAKNCDIPRNWQQNKEYKRHVTPTFACKFYDSQIAYDCSDEIPPELVPIPVLQKWIVEISGFQIMYDSQLEKYVDAGFFKKGYYKYVSDTVDVQFRFVIEFSVGRNRPSDPWSYKGGKINAAEVSIVNNIKPENDPGRIGFKASDIQKIEFSDPDCANRLVGETVGGKMVDVKDVERLYGPPAGYPSAKVPKTMALQFRRINRFYTTMYDLVKGQSTLGFEKVPHVSLRVPSFSVPLYIRFKDGNTLTITERVESTRWPEDVEAQWVPLREKDGSRQFEHVREELLGPVYPFPYMIVYYTHKVKGPF